MKEKRTNGVPITATVLLLLPLLYVGSYLANVRPGQSYRIGGGLADGFYRPLEQVDRRIRPDAWELWSPPL